MTSKERKAEYVSEQIAELKKQEYKNGK